MISSLSRKSIFTTLPRRTQIVGKAKFPDSFNSIVFPEQFIVKLFW